MSTKMLEITTRKTAGGDRPKTWGQLQLGTHKRLVDLHSPSVIVKLVTSISSKPRVEAKVSIADA